VNTAPVGRTRGPNLAEELGLAIAAGTFEPGAALDVDTLRLQHSVSRGTVREALAALAAQNMVAIRNGWEAIVAPLQERNLLDPQVLAWHTASGALAADAADLAGRLPTLAALLPRNPLVSALVRALGSGEPGRFLLPLAASDAFPVPASFCVAADSGTPVAALDPGDMPDHPATRRDLDGRVYLVVTVGESTVYRNEVPRPVVDEHGVRLPACRWIQQRVQQPDHLVTTAVREHLQGHSADDALGAAYSVGAWAEANGSPAHVVPAGYPHDHLDQPVHVVLLRTTGEHGGPVAVVITEPADKAPFTAFTVTAYRSPATAAEWQQRDHWDAVCDNDHVIRHRDGHADITAVRNLTPDAEAWPHGMTVPDGFGGWAVRCARCGAPAYPEMPED
jgi:hypothetical protein